MLTQEQIDRQSAETRENARKIAEVAARRHNARSLAGLTLRNATGDVDTASLGYQISIDTLTYIKKQITEQKFYQIKPSDFVPIAVGEGAFSAYILTNMTLNTSGNFEEGFINQGVANDRLAIADAGISSKTMVVKTWAKGINYSIIELEQALVANNWDLIEARHRARKTNWDLGVQQIAMIGATGDTTNVPGLYTQPSVNSDTSTITVSIASMTAAQFASFVAAVVAAYQSNCNYTAFPTHFVIPQSDYVALATPVSSTYPFNSKLEYLKKAFAEVVPGGVEVKSNAYGQSTYNGTGYTRYLMYRYDPESLRMDIPVNFTMTNPNTLNGFQFQDAAYGQLTGVWAYRALELLYFDF